MTSQKKNGHDELKEQRIIFASTRVGMSRNPEAPIFELKSEKLQGQNNPRKFYGTN